jgi:hydroxymethylglutaryl-CoA lyase
MLDGMGIHTGINLDRLLEAGWAISKVLERDPASKVSIAKRAKLAATN